MHGQCACTARFGDQLRWTTDTNFFHRVVGCRPVVEFFMQACGKAARQPYKGQAWISVGQAGLLLCGSSGFLLRSDQMTRVMVTLLAIMISQPGELSTTCACARWCHLWWPWRPCGPIMRRTGTCYELSRAVHAHARANSTRSRTPSLFCWQACETNETGMKPE